MSPATLTVRATATLTTRDWDSIWQLTHSFYETERTYAEQKLRDHSQIALFHDGEALVGMAALEIYPITFNGKKIVVLFTSHVLLEEGYRGQNLLQQLGLKSFLAAKGKFPLHDAYWFFDTFSYKSYLLLPRNFREFWPRYDRPLPPSERALIDHLATKHYRAAWRSHNGTVAGSEYKRLKTQSAPLDEKIALDPHVRYFVETNPCHAEGDMLVCLCPLNLLNWATLALHALRRGFRGLTKFTN